ncbi:MAG: tRNA-(ms[2]io[6]A)-hydroxylase [Candidatus Azotimanducaceae bacterium]
MNHWELKLASSSCEWLQSVQKNFDAFLIDHALNERKASASAMTLVAHYPDRAQLVEVMIELAIEELNHFKQVMKIITSRNLIIENEKKDPYVNELRRHMKKSDSEAYLLDRLLSGAVIEARGEERFRLLAENLSDQALRSFYARISASEARHFCLFLDLADKYFHRKTVQDRLSEWIEIEKLAIESLPITNRLH